MMRFKTRTYRLTGLHIRLLLAMLVAIVVPGREYHTTFAQGPKHSLSRRTIVTSAITSSFATSAKGASRSQEIPTRLFLQYGPLNDQVGDLWLPKVDSPRAVVALVHGGFWMDMYGRSLMDDLAADLTARGLAAWNLEYRRVGGSMWEGPQSTFDDITAGLKALRTSAMPLPPGLPSAVVGHSAGGHLALWSQLASRKLSPSTNEAGIRPQPCIAVSVSGVVDMQYGIRQGLGGGAVERFLGGASPSGSLCWADVSPVDMIASCADAVDLGCIGLVHGDRDGVVPPVQSIRFLEAAAQVGFPAELRRIRGEGHFEVLDPKSVSWRGTVELIEDALLRGQGHITNIQSQLSPTICGEKKTQIIVCNKPKIP